MAPEPISPIQNELYKRFEGMSLESWMHNRVIACRTNDDFIIQTATAEFARFVGVDSHRKLKGQHLLDVLCNNAPNHQWMPWHSPDNTRANWESILDRAKTVGISHKVLNCVTADMMIYRQVVEVDWIPTTRQFNFIANLYDPNVGKGAGGRKGPVCLKSDGSVGTNQGSSFNVEDMRLVIAYCDAKSVKELAEAEGRRNDQWNTKQWSSDGRTATHESSRKGPCWFSPGIREPVLVSTRPPDLAGANSEHPAAIECILAGLGLSLHERIQAAIAKHGIGRRGRHSEQFIDVVTRSTVEIVIAEQAVNHARPLR